MANGNSPRVRHERRRGGGGGLVAGAAVAVAVAAVAIAYAISSKPAPPPQARTHEATSAAQPRDVPVAAVAPAPAAVAKGQPPAAAPATVGAPSPVSAVAPAAEAARAEQAPPTAEDSGRQLNDRTYWFGNTWGYAGGGGSRGRWFQQSVDDIAIRGDRVYAITGWDEHCGEAGIYTTAGDKIGVPEPDGDWAAQFHSWGYSGGPAVCTDEQHVYYSMGQNGEANKKQPYAGVARYTLDGRAAGWPGATNNHRLVVCEKHDAKPRGLAVVDGELFVSDASADRIRVYRTADMSHARDIPFEAPGRIEVDAGASRDLWVVDTAENVVKRMSRDGKLSRVRIADCRKPAAVCLDAKGNVLVADGAPDRQRIRAYRAADGAPIAGSDYGSPVYAGPKPGVVAPGTFYRITGIRCDADGNLYVSGWEPGGRLYKFDAARKLVWERSGLEFVSCGDADPGEDTSVYSCGHRYQIDYAKPPGEGWVDAAVTLDPLKYPDDPRLGADYWMAMRMYRLGGKKLMLGRTQMGSELYLWRFDGEIAVPAAMFCQRGVQVRGTPAENFSARWTGFVTPRVPGRHVFTTRSDDGIRVWVNEQKLIDNWTGHGATDDSGRIELEAGHAYPVKVEYYQGGGGCCLQLSWQEPGRARLVVPRDVLSPSAQGGRQGLAAEYCRGTGLGEIAQKRIDAQIDFALFTGDIASPAFGAPKTEGWPPNRPMGPFLWSDADGDGTMQADEYAAAPAGAHPTVIDLDGNLWTNTGGWDAGTGSITKVPFAGLTAAGAPRWDPERATSTVIPADGGLQKLSKLHYDPATDVMYIGAWTDDHPFPGGGWEQMNTGPVLFRFDAWSKVPRLAWRRSIVPPEGLRGGVPKAWSFERDYAFVGYTWRDEQIAVDVYRLDNGARVGRLLPTADIGGVTGWTDMNDAVQTHLRADGTYVVFVEEVWMAKGIYYFWKP